MINPLYGQLQEANRILAQLIQQKYGLEKNLNAILKEINTATLKIQQLEIKAIKAHD